MRGTATNCIQRHLLRVLREARDARSLWSIFPISFDFFWHEGGMMEHFCNEKVWSVDQNEDFIFWDFHDFIFYASPPKFGGGSTFAGDAFRKASVDFTHLAGKNFNFWKYWKITENNCLALLPNCIASAKLRSLFKLV